jgi:hypothetical protein
MNTPPPQPWEKGQHEDYTCFQLIVEVLEDAEGGVWSQHRMDPESAALSATLSGGGARQIAHALLIEAVRREVFAEVLVELSKRDGYLERYQNGDARKRQEIERALANAGLAYLVEMLPKLLPGVARDVLTMVAQQQDGEPEPLA